MYKYMDATSKVYFWHETFLMIYCNLVTVDLGSWILSSYCYRYSICVSCLQFSSFCLYFLPFVIDVITVEDIQM